MAEPRKIFSTRALNRIKSSIENLTKDDSLNTTIKYRKFKESASTSFDPETQTLTSTSFYTDYAVVEAVKGHFTDKEVLLSGGMLELGDVRFLVWKNLIGGEPRVKDVIVESGVSYNVVNTWTDPLDITWVFQGRQA